MTIKRWQKALLLLIYAAVIAGLSLTPANEMPRIGLWDKAQHFAAYFVFMALACPTTDTPLQRLLMAAAIIGYSALMEFGQALSPGRSPSPHDMLANGLGVLTALLIFEGAVTRWYRSRRKA